MFFEPMWSAADVAVKPTQPKPEIGAIKFLLSL